MRFSLIVLFALVAFVGRVHGLNVWGECVSLPLSRCPETTTPGSLDKTTADKKGAGLGNPPASTVDPTAVGPRPGPDPAGVKTTTRGDMNVNIGPDTTSATSPSSSTTTTMEPPSTTAESTTASTTVPTETSTTTPIPSTGTTKGGQVVIPANSVPPTPSEVIIPGQDDTSSATSSSSPTSPNTTTPEASSTTPKVAAGTTTPVPHPPPTVWTPLAPPEIPLPVGPEETELPEVTDPSNRVVSRAPQKPDGEEKKEEGGTNLTGLWVALGVVLVLVIIGGVVAGVIIRKKRMQKKKKAGESKKTDPELGGMAALDPVGGGGEIAGSLPPVPVAVRRPKSRGRKLNDEKRWTPVKQMEAGRIVKDKFAFEGRLNFDATGNHGPLVHATADQKSHSLRDVIFADEMNKVYDMGSEIEHVVLSGEHDKPKEEEKPTEKKKEAEKEKPKTEKSAPPGDPKSQTKPPPPK